MRLSTHARFQRGIGVAAIALGLFATGKAQSFNMYEGQGVLENAWQDWSWCSDSLTSTSYAYTGTQSVEVSYTAGYQGFSLESPTSFQAGYFSALSFYINGGPTPNRSISVQMTVNGASTNSVNLNAYIVGGNVPANGWAQVSIPLSAFGLKPTDQISRFWLQESSGSAQPPFWLAQIGWTPVPAPATTGILINRTVLGQTVGPLMFGVNTAVWDSGLDTPACESLVSQSGFKAFRFPGGSLSDSYSWTTNSIPGVSSWATNFDQFAAAAAPNAGQNLITVNYGTSTAADAAAWVKYSNVTKKYGMKYWEVGNEVYGSWETDSHAAPHDPITYANQFAQYYTAMKAQDPTISVGAVAAPGEDSYVNYPSEIVKNPVTGAIHSGWTAVMLSTLAKLKVQPDFVIYHRYPEYANDCDFTLLAGNTSFTSDVANLNMQVADYGGASATKTQIFCTETNCDAGPEGKQMCSLVDGLFLADSFGTMLQTKCKSMLWWDLINGIDTAGDNGSWLYGWREYGDEGIFSPDFTKIYPTFYVEQLLNDFAKPGDQAIQAVPLYNMMSAYATLRSDGSIRVMVINKNPTATLSTTVDLLAYTPASSAQMYRFGIAEDNEAKNGQPQSVTVSTIPHVESKTVVAFPPYSVSVLVFTPATAP
jgi:alpha-N-arabinofuranosidase